MSARPVSKVDERQESGVGFQVLINPVEVNSGDERVLVTHHFSLVNISRCKSIRLDMAVDHIREEGITESRFCCHGSGKRDPSPDSPSFQATDQSPSFR